IASGQVSVNGEVETRRGRQLHPGDEVGVTSSGQTVTETVDLTEPDVPW
ncbi:MAG: RNA-binding S4 domain-containing protein, partial [Cutibacterium sp.]|nr:RNA-binding S4 domain-containing protein [Cutibacterium sp.]